MSSQARGMLFRIPLALGLLALALSRSRPEPETKDLLRWLRAREIFNQFRHDVLRQPAAPPEPTVPPAEPYPNPGSDSV